MHDHPWMLSKSTLQRRLQAVLCFCVCSVLALSLWDCGGRKPLNDCSISNPCAGGELCVLGRCQCEQPRAICEGKCIDTTTDTLHCGACGIVCPVGQGCVAGKCGGNQACPPGFLTCRGECTDTGSNALHCGGCDAPCSATQSCVSGVCQCLATETACPGPVGTPLCIDIQASPDHCGACDNACGPGQGCIGGACADQPGEPSPADRSNPNESTADSGAGEQTLPPETVSDALANDADPPKESTPTEANPPEARQDQTPSASLWAKAPVATSLQQGQGVAVDASGNIYVTGFFTGQATFGTQQLTSKGGRDIFLAKLDSQGNWVWAQQAGSVADDEANAVALDASGNVYVTGYFRASLTFGQTTLQAKAQDIFVLKFAPDGKPLGARQGGSAADDVGYGIVVDAKGDVFVTGSIRLTATFGAHSAKAKGGTDVFVAKLSGTTGDWLWATQGGSALGDLGYGIVADAQGNAYVTGYYNGKPDFGVHALNSSGAEDVFVAKIDSSGQWLWAKTAGDNGVDVGRSIAIDSKGNLLVTGLFTRDAVFGTQKITSLGAQDIFVAKMDPAGNWLWARQAGSRNNEMGAGVAVDSLDNVTICGHFLAGATFGGNSLTAKGGLDAFVAKLTGSGTWLWVRRAGANINDACLGVAVDSGANIVTTGYFQGSADFGTTTLNPTAGISTFIWKMSP